jgi:catechol 2,3-dioxygenase
VRHVHLHVADIDATTRFYHDLLGFVFPLGYHPSMPNPFGDTAMFFAAGDYHHHIGTNTWQGVGAPTPPADATGLRYFSVVLPSADDLAHLRARLQVVGTAMEETAKGMLIRDPASNGVALTAP